MFQDALLVSPFHAVGTVTRRWLVAVSFAIFLPSAFGQGDSAPAPLPRNLTPNQAPDETGRTASVFPAFVRRQCSVRTGFSARRRR